MICNCTPIYFLTLPTTTIFKSMSSFWYLTSAMQKNLGIYPLQWHLWVRLLKVCSRLQAYRSRAHLRLCKILMHISPVDWSLLKICRKTHMIFAHLWWQNCKKFTQITSNSLSNTSLNPTLSLSLLSQTFSNDASLKYPKSPISPLSKEKSLKLHPFPSSQTFISWLKSKPKRTGPNWSAYLIRSGTKSFISISWSSVLKIFLYRLMYGMLRQWDFQVCLPYC